MSAWSDAPTDGWKPPPIADEIHLWRADLDRSPESLATLAATLAADERERAARFRFAEHRNRFVAGRGLLRELLSIYLDRPAVALRFEQGSHGKPALAGEDAGAGLHFNLSHSGGQALYAVARRAVGTDLECHHRTMQFAAIIDRVCTPREFALFQAQPDDLRRETFFVCWTRKEAIAKALGGGLSSGLRNLEVCFQESVRPDDRACLNDAEGREWSVLTLPLGPGWSGALAAAGMDWRWRGWRLREGLVDSIKG